MRFISMTLLAILALTFSSSAIGQYVLYEDDFTNGVGDWTTDSPWHWAPANDPCTSLSNVPPSYGAMARMGDPDCTFNSIDQQPQFAARMQAVSDLLIPLDAVNPRLEYDSYVDSEACSGWDIHQIFLSVTGGSSWQFVGGDCDAGFWHAVSLDLSPWRGQRVRIGFEFAAVDGDVNDGLGWLVDNVRVVADCAAQNYCVGAANSASPTGAVIGHTGSLSLAQNDFALTLHHGPSGQFGLFLYGPFQAQTPVAQGFLCIGPDAFGFRRLFPAVLIDANGNASRQIDFPALTGAHAVLPGTQVNFQCWYRDFVGGISVSNFSDAQSITFCP